MPNQSKLRTLEYPFTEICFITCFEFTRQVGPQIKMLLASNVPMFQLIELCVGITLSRRIGTNSSIKDNFAVHMRVHWAIDATKQQAVAGQMQFGMAIT